MAVATEGLLVSSDPRAIERMDSVNLVAPMLMARLILKRVIRARCGRVINITSVAARRAYRGLATNIAAKAGMEAFTRTLVAEVGRRRITLNAAAPGYLGTDMSACLTETQRARILGSTPQGRSRATGRRGEPRRLPTVSRRASYYGRDVCRRWGEPVKRGPRRG